MNSKLIVIEGLDGSGKETQSKLLVERLQSNGINARLLSFPCYNSESSGPLRMYLNGQISKDPNDVNCYAAATMFAIDRYIDFKTHWEKEYDKGMVFVCDRYVLSNVLYQMIKLPESEWFEFWRWVKHLEYNLFNLPHPDLTLYLNVNSNVCNKLTKEREEQGKSKRDIHELNSGIQSKVEAAASYVCPKLSNLCKIDCCNSNKTLKNTDEILNNIYTAVLDWFTEIGNENDA